MARASQQSASNRSCKARAGILIQPPGFLSAVRQLADDHDVLLIADEVATGFGRTGKMFACEHDNVSPDLMCVAKGITGGYLPLAATFATQKIFDAFLGDPSERRTFFHGHTYTGNPLACAAAMASLDLFEKNDLVRSVAKKTLALATMLEPLKSLPAVKEIRQKGFMGRHRASPASIHENGPAAAVCTAVRKHGVITRPLGDVIVLMPPLAMGVEDLSLIVNAIYREVANLANQ